MQFYAGDYVRLDWGFSTPNIAGALISSIIVAVWVLPSVQRYLCWLALGASLILGGYLGLTFSRGAFLALLIGLVPVAMRARHSPRGFRVVTILGVGSLLAFYASIGATGRTEKGLTLEDKSASNRLLIYKEAPRMIWDNPGGWKKWNVADAYHNYYQPPEYSKRLRNLISMHFTWLAEWPLLISIGYLSAWGLVLTLFWPTPDAAWKAPILGSWLTLGIAGLFSHISRDTFLVWLPVSIVTIYGLVRVFLEGRSSWRRLWPACGWVPASFVAVFFLVIGIYTLVSDAKLVPVVVEGSMVYLGNGEQTDQPDITVIGKRDKLLGSDSGKIFRKWLLKYPAKTIAVGDLVSPLPRKLTVRQLICCGEAVDDWTTYFDTPEKSQYLETVVFLNPAKVDSTFLENLAKDVDVKVVFGQFYNDTALASWKKLMTERGQQVDVKPAGYYLEDGFSIALDAFQLEN